MHANTQIWFLLFESSLDYVNRKRNQAADILALLEDQQSEFLIFLMFG